MIHIVTFPFLVTQCSPTMAQLIMRCCTTQSGTCYSFISDEPCAHLLDYHSYLTCLYLPFEPETKFPPEFRQRKFVLPDHFAPFPPTWHHFALHCPTALPSLPFTNSLLPHPETIPYHLIPPSELHRVYA